MLEKIGHIKNPLTVIAMFAAIAEVSGTIVLPMVDASVQEIYVWFLMLFPTLLVWLFFRTLWIDHRVLYAPSDYREEDNFMSHFVKRTSTNSSGESEPIGLAEEAGEKSAIDLSTAEQQDDLTNKTSTAAQQKPFENEGSAIEDGPQPTPGPEVVVESSSETLGKVFQEAKVQVNPARFKDKNKDKFLLNLSGLTKHIVGQELVSDFGGEYIVNVSPKSFPNAKFDVVVQSPEHYGVAQIINGNFKFYDSVTAMAVIKNFYNTLADSEKSRFFARIVLIMEPLEMISESERRQFVSAVQEMPFKVEIEERYPALNRRQMMEIS